MTRARRTDDWGFPRWRAYGGGGAPVDVRTCDRDGCDRPGDRPAPKAPNRPERWYFCETHAAEYNKDWDYFAGLSAEEAAARTQSEAGQRQYTRAKHWEWGGAGDGSRSRAEVEALSALGLTPDADMAAAKIAWRAAAKANHPDIAGADPEAAKRFRAIQAAWEILERAEAVRVADSAR